MWPQERAPATAILLFAIMLTISVGLMNLILAARDSVGMASGHPRASKSFEPSENAGLDFAGIQLCCCLTLASMLEVLLIVRGPCGSQSARRRQTAQLPKSTMLHKTARLSLACRLE